MIMVKRAYEPAEGTDGTRLLVERLWPRGLTKEAVHVDKSLVNNWSKLARRKKRSKTRSLGPTNRR